MDVLSLCPEARQSFTMAMCKLIYVCKALVAQGHAARGLISIAVLHLHMRLWRNWKLMKENITFLSNYSTDELSSYTNSTCSNSRPFHLTFLISILIQIQPILLFLEKMSYLDLIKRQELLKKKNHIIKHEKFVLENKNYLDMNHQTQTHTAAAAHTHTTKSRLHNNRTPKADWRPARPVFWNTHTHKTTRQDTNWTHTHTYK